MAEALTTRGHSQNRKSGKMSKFKRNPAKYECAFYREKMALEKELSLVTKGQCYF